MKDNFKEYMQENILHILIMDDVNYKLILHIAKDNYFESSFHRNIFKKTIHFLLRYKKTPKNHIYELLETEIKDNEVYLEILDNIINVEVNTKFVLDEFTTFVRQQQLKLGIISAAEEIEKGNLLEAEKHITDLRKKDIDIFDKGSYLDTSFFEQEAIEIIPTGIQPMDNIGCCPTKKEMIALGALPGYGKSHFLTHLGKVGVFTKHKVLHITLEMSEELQKQRYIQSMFGVTKRESKGLINIFNKDENGYLIDYKQEEIDYKLSLLDENSRQIIDKKLRRFPTKNLLIKAFPSGHLTIPILENYLDTLIDYKNFHPDMIMIDYPKKMNINPRFLREELGSIYIKLKGLADKYNVAMVVVAQFNREGKKDKVTWLDESYLQEDFSLINEVAWFITYNQTPYEYDNKLARLFISKGRNDIKGTKILLSQDYNCCQFALDAIKFKKESYRIKND